MKTSQRIASILLVTTGCMTMATLAGHASVILADVRGNYLANHSLPLTDTAGTGSWSYYSSAILTPTSPSSRTTLSWVAATSGGHNAFYGTSGANNVPAVAGTTSAFLDGKTPLSNQIAWHPGPSLDSDIEWTAGAGETGVLTLSGDFSRIGENAIHSPPGGASTTTGGLVNFTIYVNGVSEFSETGVKAGQSDPFSFTFTSALNTKVDFVLSEDGTSYSYDESLLSAQIIAAPEPRTWAMMVCGLVLVGVLMRRRGAKS
jgi:hypothetical protein